MLASSHQIWLAGLGAFSKAQEGGAKVFETLVEARRSARGQDAQGRGANGRRRARRRHVQGQGNAGDRPVEPGTSSSRCSRIASRGRWRKLGVHTSADVERLSRARQRIVRSGERAAQGARRPAETTAIVHREEDGGRQGRKRGEEGRLSNGQDGKEVGEDCQARPGRGGSRRRLLLPTDDTPRREMPNIRGGFPGSVALTSDGCRARSPRVVLARLSYEP